MKLSITTIAAIGAIGFCFAGGGGQRRAGSRERPGSFC
jgi:hypothetical protein